MIDKLIIDFDCTAYNTIKAIVDLYDNDFYGSPGYEKLHWTEINTWDFIELKCASKEYIDTYFNQMRFFETIEPMYNFNEIINRLKDQYKIQFCSMGSHDNLYLKQRFLKYHYPYADFIGVNINEMPDKSHIDMRNSVFIDDSKKNLETSNAELKVLFGDDYSWNEGYKGLRCYNWYDVERSLRRWI